jgi:hypothetical protein
MENGGTGLPLTGYSLDLQHKKLNVNLLHIFNYYQDGATKFIR